MRLSTIINNSEQFLPREREVIVQYLHKLGYTCDGIDFYWCWAMDSDNGVLGAYTPKKKHTIYLQKPEIVIYNYDVIQQYIVNLLPTAVHELTHREQYLRNPLLYRFLAIPFVREFTIESEARGAEREIEKHIDRIV